MSGSTIHDVKWSPDGESFIVVSGSQPAKIVIFDKNCNQISEIDAGYKNYAEFSDGGRFLMLGGFGNLAGDVEFWEIIQKKAIIGNCKAYCTVSSEWAQNSSIVMTAILNPRMRIDNAITFYDFTGKRLVSDPFDKSELYEVKWIKTGTAKDETGMVVNPAIAAKKMKVLAVKPSKPEHKEEKKSGAENEQKEEKKAGAKKKHKKKPKAEKKTGP